MAKQEYGRVYGEHVSEHICYFPNQTAFISLDFNPDKLIVRIPTLGHEIMSDLFDVMKQSGTGYSREAYRGSRIILGGSPKLAATLRKRQRGISASRWGGFC